MRADLQSQVRRLLSHKEYIFIRWSCRQKPPLSMRNLNFVHKSLKCFHEKIIFVKSGVADENPLLVCGIHFSLSHGSKMIFRTCPSFINLFPDHFFFEKIRFLYKWSCRQGPPIFVWNVVFTCSSASGMHHYFTVQLYTTWRHPSLSFVYETFLTFR